MRRTLLLVDDEENVIRALRRLLREEGYEILSANSGDEALSILQNQAVSVIISDQRMPGMTGAELLKKVGEKHPETVRMMLSGYADFQAVIQSINDGSIYKFITKPWQEDVLKNSIQNAFSRFEMHQESRFIAHVYDNAVEGIVITDHSGKILSVNPAFLNMTGTAESQWVGETKSLLALEKEDARFVLSIRSRLDLEGYWNGETWLKKSNGDYSSIWLSISAVHDDQAKVKQYVYTFIDIVDFEKRNKDKTTKDSLTGLVPRTEFINDLSKHIPNFDLQKSVGLLLVFGLNRFRNINDALGYNIGDALLKGLAQRIIHRMKDAHSISRLGGDEFALLIETKRDHFMIEEVIDRLKSVFDTPFRIEKEELYVTVSIGMCYCPEDGETADALLENALSAMMHAKKGKELTHQRYMPMIGSTGKMKFSLENDLHRAILNEEFELFYQPQFSIQNELKVCGFEGLIRWRHPTRGLVPPDQFLPLSEETGLIIKIENWVIRHGFKMAKRLADLGYDDLILSLNLSAGQLIRTSLLTLVKTALRETGADPKNLGFEVTERLFFEDLETSLIVLNSLSRMGFEFSIDDFGTGYSSFENLKLLPIKVLKIDRSFIRSLAVDSRDRAIVQAMIVMGKKLGLKILAEGVEDKEQLKILEELGCDCVQGYLLGKPVMEQDILNLLKSSTKNTAD